MTAVKTAFDHYFYTVSRANTSGSPRGAPGGGTARLPAVLHDYRALFTRFDTQAGTGIQDRNSGATHAHPWVGPLTAHQWLNLAAVHQRVHRKQIQAIRKRTGRQAC